MLTNLAVWLETHRWPPLFRTFYAWLAIFNYDVLVMEFVSTDPYVALMLPIVVAAWAILCFLWPARARWGPYRNMTQAAFEKAHNTVTFLLLLSDDVFRPR